MESLKGICRWGVVFFAAGVVLAACSQPVAQPPPILPLMPSEPELHASLNEARAEGRYCGSDYFGAAPPVAPNALLEAAALIHSQDMAAHGFFSHTGSDGSSVQERVERQGYRWMNLGENLATGALDVPTAIAGWLASPSHCRVLMGAQFEAYGFAEAASSGKHVSYWTLVMARPLR